MKQLYFVSTGRCGTKRIAEILKNHLPAEDFVVQHQMDISRLANVLGNLMYYFGEWDWLKRKLYHHIERKYIHKKHFISCDPLISMILPKKVISDPNICIVHIIRDQEEFAHSFYNFTRKKLPSFIAHNFIPFWQIGVWPLENVLNNKIKDKYKKVWQKKNDWFKYKYYSQNYISINFNKLFIDNTLNSLTYNCFDQSINIVENELIIKTNQSI